MKLGHSMDSKPTYTITDMPTAQAGRDVRKPKMVKRAVIVITGLVVASLVVGLSVYFGMTMARDTYQEAWQTFSQNGKKVEEKITVKEDSVDIKVPNEMEIIYDYKHGIAVRRFVNQETKEVSACYAYYINETTAATREDVRDENMEVPEEGETIKENYKPTDKKVPSVMLSQDVKDMCEGTNVYWMEVEQEHEVEKRATCAYIGYVRLYYRGGCHLYVKQYTLCYNSSKSLIAWRVDWFRVNYYFC